MSLPENRWQSPYAEHMRQRKEIQIVGLPDDTPKIRSCDLCHITLIPNPQKQNTYFCQRCGR